jgi:hypothetical protein
MESEPTCLDQQHCRLLGDLEASIASAEANLHLGLGCGEIHCGCYYLLCLCDRRESLGNFRCNFWLKVGRLVAGLANRVSEASASVLNRSMQEHITF